MIEIIRPGQFTTIQDLGRFGYRSIGVPVSGPMDQDSASLANQLLGNEPNDALIEMTYVGATFLFHTSATVSITGANCEVKLDNELVEDKSVFRVDAGSTVSFGAMKDGNFAYLGIIGGFISEKTLGSSCYLPSINGLSRMTKGMKVFFDETIQDRAVNFDQKRQQLPNPNQFLEVEEGPEFQSFSQNDIQLLTTTEFTISPQSNRMGFQLNEKVTIDSTEIISSPVQAGTIQLTQSGQLIVLMRDAQTIGGYPRVLQLTDKSINQLAQISFETPFSFKLLSNLANRS